MIRRCSRAELVGVAADVTVRTTPVKIEGEVEETTPVKIEVDATVDWSTTPVRIEGTDVDNTTPVKMDGAVAVPCRT